MLNNKWKEKSNLISELESQVRSMRGTWEDKEKKLTTERDRAIDAARTALDKMRTMDDSFRYGVFIDDQLNNPIATCNYIMHIFKADNNTGHIDCISEHLSILIFSPFSTLFRKQIDSAESSHQMALDKLANQKQEEIDAANHKVLEVEQEMRELLRETANSKKLMEDRVKKLTRAFAELQEDIT